MTSRLLTANQGIRPAPFVSSPVGAGVVWSGVGAFMAARARGPCRPPCPLLSLPPTKGLSRGPQKLDTVLRQQTAPVSTVPSVPTATSTPPTTTSTTPGELAGAWESPNQQSENP